MDKKLVYFKFQKIIVYGILVLMAIQLLYMNSEFGYAHLVLYILFLISMDIYKLEYRMIKTELVSNVLFVLATVSLMLSNYLGDITALIYYPILIGLAMINIKLVMLSKAIYIKKEHHKVNDRNIKMFQREGKFLIIYTYIVSILLIGIVGMAVYSFITL